MDPGLPHLLGTGRRAYAWIKGYRASSGPPWPDYPNLHAQREMPRGATDQASGGPSHLQM